MVDGRVGGREGLSWSNGIRVGHLAVSLAATPAGPGLTQMLPVGGVAASSTLCCSALLTIANTDSWAITHATRHRLYKFSGGERYRTDWSKCQYKRSSEAHIFIFSLQVK